MNHTAVSNNVNLARLKWLCRRGMLELDLLLEQFLLRYYLELNVSEQTILQELLQASDQDLLAWILEQQPVPTKKFLPLLAKIRDYQPCQYI